MILDDGEDLPFVGIGYPQHWPGGDPGTGMVDGPDGMGCSCPEQGLFIPGLDHVRPGLAAELVDGGISDVGADLDLVGACPIYIRAAQSAGFGEDFRMPLLCAGLGMEICPGAAVRADLVAEPVFNREQAVFADICKDCLQIRPRPLQALQGAAEFPVVYPGSDLESGHGLGL